MFRSLSWCQIAIKVWQFLWEIVLHPHLLVVTQCQILPNARFFFSFLFFCVTVLKENRCSLFFLGSKNTMSFLFSPFLRPVWSLFIPLRWRGRGSPQIRNLLFWQKSGLLRREAYPLFADHFRKLLFERLPYRTDSSTAQYLHFFVLH